MRGTLLRGWRRNPLLTAQFVLTIAVGLGTTTAMTSLLLALGHQPLPFRDPERLVAVWGSARSSGHPMALSGPDVADFADATHNIFASFGAFSFPTVWLVDRTNATKVLACYIQASAFSDLGIRPVLGREVRLDDQPMGKGATAPAWISYDIWKTRYGGSPSAIGKTIAIASSATGLYEMPARIVGVLPEGVGIPLPFAQNTFGVWYLTDANIAARSPRSTVFFGVGRLRRGVSAAQAQSALTVIAERLEQRYTIDRGKLPVVQSLDAIAHGPAQKTMGLLALGVGLVFFVGCVNLAILMGAEGRRRTRETAIRAALGADSWRLWQEVVAEKSLLTLLSLGLGVVFASVLLRVLTYLVPAAGLGPPLLHPPPFDLGVLLGFASFAFVAALLWSALVVAAAVGSGSSRTLAAVGGATGYTGISDTNRRAGRWRLVLLSVQAGLGVSLFAAAALTAKTYVALSAADLGPAPRHTVLLSVTPRDNFVPSDSQVENFNDELLSRLDRLPGTQAIALADLFPPPGLPISFVKQGDATDIMRPTTLPVSVSPGYFRTLGISILFGRPFPGADNASSEPAAIVSLDMAERNWATPRAAVGSSIAFGPKYDARYRIVGVAANFTGYWSQEPVPTVYLPQAQSAYFCGGEVILRTTNSPKSVSALAPQVLSGMPIAATISDVSTMRARWQTTLTRPFARMAGMLLLALLGLGLSVQGVYAVAAATTSARRHEFAVRSVLGAPRGRLIWNATRDLVLAVAVGSALGIAAALELWPVLEQWLGSAAIWHTGPIALAVLVLMTAAAAGCYLPARAAVRINPADVLRLG